MAAVHVDHPGEVTWFPNQTPATVLGPCPHTCAHDQASVIAWGPDNDHYELIRCDVPDGCAGTCRAWMGSWDADTAYREGRPRFRTWPYLHVALPAAPTEEPNRA